MISTQSVSTKNSKSNIHTYICTYKVTSTWLITCYLGWVGKEINQTLCEPVMLSCEFVSITMDQFKYQLKLLISTYVIM
jgi:hypothetical protein